MQDERKKVDNSTVPFFPNHFITELAVAMGVLGVIFILSGVFTKGLGPPANPVMTPSHIAPEWYFLWMFGLLKIMPQLLGLFIPMVLGIIVILLPWLDRSESRKPEKRSRVIISTEVILIIMVILTYIGIHF